MKIDYTATTDKDTVLNLTNHSYFNLAGQGNGDILQHQLTLYASQFTPVDATLIPTGKLQDVHNTPFDFLQPIAIGARINMNDEQLRLGRGYDHNWVLDKKSPTSLSPAARAYDAQSGRVLEVSTTEPGVQFYSGNFLDGTIHGKDGKVYGYRCGVLPGNAAFPRFAESEEFSFDGVEAGANVALDFDLQVHRTKVSSWATCCSEPCSRREYQASGESVRLRKAEIVGATAAVRIVPAANRGAQ